MIKDKRFQGALLFFLVAFMIWNLWPASEDPETKPKRKPNNKAAASSKNPGANLPLPHLDVSFFTVEDSALEANGNGEPALGEGPEFFPRNLFKLEPDPYRIYSDNLAKEKTSTTNAINAMKADLEKIRNLESKSHYDRLDESVKNSVSKDVPKLLAEGKGVEYLMTGAITIADYKVLKGHANRVKGQANGVNQELTNAINKLKASDAKVIADKLPVPPPPAPQINFEFIGYFGHANQKIAVLRKKKDNEQVLVYANSTLDNLFIIEDIGYDSCLIGFVGWDEKKRIPLLGAAK